MNPVSHPQGAGAIALAGLALAVLVASPGQATAPQSTRTDTVLPPTPDFEIYAPRDPSIDEQHPDVAHDPQEEDCLMVFSCYTVSGEHDIRGIIVSGATVPGQKSIPITVSDSNAVTSSAAVTYAHKSNDWRWHGRAGEWIAPLRGSVSCPTERFTTPVLRRGSPRIHWDIRPVTIRPLRPWLTGAMPATTAPRPTTASGAVSGSPPSTSYCPWWHDPGISRTGMAQQSSTASTRCHQHPLLPRGAVSPPIQVQAAPLGSERTSAQELLARRYHLYAVPSSSRDAFPTDEPTSYQKPRSITGRKT
jgi:hypothetical protein